jgi:hypothetical protein
MSPTNSPGFPWIPPGICREVYRALPMTQVEIGHATLMVGGSVLNGMHTLGGIVLSAAKSWVVLVCSGPSLRHATGELSGGGVVRFLFHAVYCQRMCFRMGKREEELSERRYWRMSLDLLASPGAAGAGAFHALSGFQAPEGGCWV